MKEDIEYSAKIIGKVAELRIDEKKSINQTLL